MTDDLSRRRVALGLAASALVPAQALAQNDTYSQDEILGAAQRFFGAGAEGLATVVARVFEDQGRPNGYIEGNEGAGAAGVGLRYGSGNLHLKGSSETTRVYWQGPSVGFDAGGNAARVFTLVYRLRRLDDIFRRYPGVDGSAYFVGGVGVNYQERDNVVLAPIRVGVGLRLGANIGYLSYTRRRRILPF
ncbi:MAG: DUF1134 domain-containing protein [Vitreimonas sp.]